MPDTEIDEAIELAAGVRIRSGMFEPKTTSRHDLTMMKKMILLFLESLDADLTVGEIRDQLED